MSSTETAMNISQALRRKWGRVPQFSLNQPPFYLKIREIRKCD
jgi:hypothetical protein